MPETLELDYGPSTNGELAYFDGAPLSSNPHKVGTQDHCDWYQGWAVGKSFDEGED